MRNEKRYWLGNLIISSGTSGGQSFYLANYAASLIRNPFCRLLPSRRQAICTPRGRTEADYCAYALLTEANDVLFSFGEVLSMKVQKQTGMGHSD